MRINEIKKIWKENLQQKSWKIKNRIGSLLLILFSAEINSSRFINFILKCVFIVMIESKK